VPIRHSECHLFLAKIKQNGEHFIPISGAAIWQQMKKSKSAGR